MGAVVEEKATTPKVPQKVLGEVRSNKIVKKNRDKKAPKGVDIYAVTAAAEHISPNSEDTQDARDKRNIGIVIDGKTYTCATCKTGHRVGICKHARERPMTATHPPGRPPAGAPKKVICDCPKQCNCKKRDCKCARRCSCTQIMYMLVHVPTPEGEEDMDEEKGSWKLGQQVTTDLKGNILTPEQIKQRKEQKDAQKTVAPDSRTATVSVSSTIEPRTSSSPSVAPSASGGCCKHKENVATRNIIAQELPQSGKFSETLRDGCNCGSSCICAFCPEHPNNSTSINMARQQAMHFANQPFRQDPQAIVSFSPTVPQGASCMGGYPQFAISRYPEMPSFRDLRRTFPQPGYVIGYPIWSTRTDSSGYPLAPFPVQSALTPNIGLINGNTLSSFHSSLQSTPLGTPQFDLPLLDVSQDEFGIGNAFVASAGPGGWDQTLTSPSIWASGMESSALNRTEPNFADTLDLPAQSFGQPDLSNTPNDPAFEFTNDLLSADQNTFLDFTNITPTTSLVDNQQLPTVIGRSCCAELQKGDTTLHNYDFADNHFSPIGEKNSSV